MVVKQGAQMRVRLLAMIVTGMMFGCGSKPPAPTPTPPPTPPSPETPKVDPSDARSIVPTDNPSKAHEVDAAAKKPNEE